MPFLGEKTVQRFMRLERERLRLHGTCCTYYSLDEAENVDPLYNEPLGYDGSDSSREGAPFNYRDPAELHCTFQYVEARQRNASVREEGLFVDWDAELTFPRLDWEEQFEDHVRPKEGDVVDIHGMHWVVRNAGRAGYILNTPEYVGWMLRLDKQSTHDPDFNVP